MGLYFNFWYGIGDWFGFGSGPEEVRQNHVLRGN
jgi:hypothetical protein